METGEPTLEQEKPINSRLKKIRQAMDGEDLPELTGQGTSILEKIRREMSPAARIIKKDPKAPAADLIPTKIKDHKIREQKKAKMPPKVKHRPKKRVDKHKPKSRTDYNAQELFERLSEAHQKIADSLKNGKRRSAKRRYHQELAEAYAFVANREIDEENFGITRIAPMFKGALIMTHGRGPPKYY